MRHVERYDIAVVGAGPAGEAATHHARGRGASVAVIDRELFGGSCPFWACMPSKALLHAAAVHHAGGAYDWPKASAFRDYMISREGTAWPSDHGHVAALEGAGATVIRGEASFVAPGRLRIGAGIGAGIGAEPDAREIQAGAVILAVGSVPRIPDLPGLDEVDAWTNRHGTSTRDLPRSLLVLGGGPSGVELAQVYARYGVPVTIVHPRDRVIDRDHPRSSEFLADGLRRDGATLRLGVRATRVRPRAGGEDAHVIDLSDGSAVEAHEILLAIGRDLPLDRLGLRAIGVTVERGRLAVDDRLRVADGVWAAGDVAGPELHTHLAHYSGEMAARQALGDDVAPIWAAIPRATYTDPETASVGLLVEQARERGIDAVELTADVATSAKGYTSEASGHVTIVVDRANRVLVGAFMAGPAVSEAIHECVLAVRARVPLDVLADTIHAFPTLARVTGGLFVQAAREL